MGDNIYLDQKLINSINHTLGLAHKSAGPSIINAIKRMSGGGSRRNKYGYDWGQYEAPEFVKREDRK